MVRNILSASSISLIRAFTQFLMMLILTRFVEASSYGIMAFVVPIWTFITMISEMGLGNAIVRSPELSRKEAGGAVKIASGSGIVGALIMAAACWPASIVLDDTRIIPVLLSFCVVLLLAMQATVPRALLERQLQYALIARIEIFATLIAVPVCIWSAAVGAQVWSLVAYHMLVQFIRVGSFFTATRRLVDLKGSWHLARPLVAFGSWILAFNLQNFLARNIDNLLIGSFLGVAALGVYGLSYQIMTLPLMLVTWPASNVLLATLSDQARHSTSNSGDFTQALLVATALITFPLCTYFMIGVDFPARAFMGSSWQQVPEVLLWMAPVGAIQSVAAYSGAVLTASGRVKFYFIFGVFNTVVLLSAFTLGVRYDLSTFVGIYAVTAILLALIHLYVISRIIGLDIWAIIRCLTPGVLAALCATTGFLGVGLLIKTGDLTEWCLSTIGFIASLGSALFMLRAQIRTRLTTILQYNNRISG